MRAYYDIETLYDSASIKAMTKMTYDLFHPQISGRIYLISIALMAGGVIGSSYSESPLFIAIIALGCFIFTAADYGPKTAAKQILSNMNENYPLMKFSFRSDNIVVTTPNETGVVHYDILVRLAESRQHLFLFSSERAAYSFSKADFKDFSVEEFKSFIQEKTGLSFERAPSFQKKIQAAIRSSK